ncbi:MAG: hypothetical protein HFJ51_04610 [Clostridia bacterium]|nr:hypothetical protein [Clostridia bacterium]
MLNILYNIKEELKFDIVVCHVNHMIREEADIDEEFVADFCKQKGIHFEAKRIDVEKISKEKKKGAEETRTRGKI